MIRLKTAEEIAILREGGRRLAAVVSHITDEVRPGVSTKRLNDIADELMRKDGDVPAFYNHKPQGSRRPYPASICVSINDEIVHGIPNENDRTIREGDIVSLDAGLIHRDLIVDTAFSVVAGEGDEETLRLVRTTKEALMTGIREAKRGNHTGDIGHAIGKFVAQKGYSIFRELVGHGVGYELHEDPYVPNFGEKGSGEELVEGLVIAIEPMVGEGGEDIVLASDGYTYKTKDGSRSAHFEHTIAITKEGPLILTTP